MSSELTYDDFLDRLSIQEVLVDAGYHLNKRDGLRYPSYVRTDSEGRRVRGDKFIVTQNGNVASNHRSRRCIMSFRSSRSIQKCFQRTRWECLLTDSSTSSATDCSTNP